MNDSEMIGGFYPRPKHERAPNFVIGKGSFNVKQLREWMGAHLKANPDAEWINFDMKVSKAGKGYAVIDTWEPGQQAQQPPPAAPDAFDNADVPF